VITQDTANHIFIDLHTERQGDLLGNSGIAQLGFRCFIATSDELFLRSFRSRPMTVPR
jgi:hypothetical protein